MPDQDDLVPSATLWKITAQMAREDNARDQLIARLEAKALNEDERAAVQLLLAAYRRTKCIDLFTSKEYQLIREALNRVTLRYEEAKKIDNRLDALEDWRTIIDLTFLTPEDQKILRDVIRDYAADAESKRNWHEWVLQKVAESALSLLVLIPASTALVILLHKVLGL